MGRLFKPWSYVGAAITESELSDFISNILHHFMVAHSQSNELPLKDKPCASHLKNTASLKNTCPIVYNLIRRILESKQQ